MLLGRERLTLCEDRLKMVKSIFEKWKEEISDKIKKCKNMQELKKELVDELYGVNEYLEDGED